VHRRPAQRHALHARCYRDAASDGPPWLLIFKRENADRSPPPRPPRWRSAGGAILIMHCWCGPPLAPASPLSGIPLSTTTGAACMSSFGQRCRHARHRCRSRPSRSYSRSCASKPALGFTQGRTVRRCARLWSRLMLWRDMR